MLSTVVTLALKSVISDNPRAGSVITFAHKICITICGLKGQVTTQSSLKERNEEDHSSLSNPSNRIVQTHGAFCAIWIDQDLLSESFGVSLLDNVALGHRFDVPMAVPIVFRSGDLIVNMILDYLAQGRRYNTQRIIAATLVFVGIAVVTTSEASLQRPTITTASSSIAETILVEYFIGCSS